MGNKPSSGKSGKKESLLAKKSKINEDAIKPSTQTIFDAIEELYKIICSKKFILEITPEHVFNMLLAGSHYLEKFLSKENDLVEEEKTYDLNIEEQLGALKTKVKEASDFLKVVIDLIPIFQKILTISEQNATTIVQLKDLSSASVVVIANNANKIEDSVKQGKQLITYLKLSITSSPINYLQTLFTNIENNQNLLNQYLVSLDKQKLSALDKQKLSANVKYLTVLLQNEKMLDYLENFKVIVSQLNGIHNLLSNIAVNTTGYEPPVMVAKNPATLFNQSNQSQSSIPIYHQGLYDPGTTSAQETNNANTSPSLTFTQN